MMQWHCWKQPGTDWRAALLSKIAARARLPQFVQQLALTVGGNSEAGRDGVRFAQNPKKNLHTTVR